MEMHVQMLQYKLFNKKYNRPSHTPFPPPAKISLEILYKSLNFHAWSAMHSAGDQPNYYEQSCHWVLKLSM